MKLKKIILVHCFLLSIIMILASCGEASQLDSSASGNKTPNKEKTVSVSKNKYANVTNFVEDGFFYLGDFESFDQCRQYSVSPGMRATMNTDKQFVKHGEQSIKIELEGVNPGWDTAEASPTFSIASNKYFQKTDFSDCSKLIFEVYCAQEEGAVLWINIKAQWLCGYSFGLVHGWNTLEIEKWQLNYTYQGLSVSTPETVDPEQSFANEINAIIIGFPVRSTFKGETQLYYLDSIRAELEKE